MEGSLLAEYIGAYVGINGTPYRRPRSGYGSAANVHELPKKKPSDVVLESVRVRLTILQAGVAKARSNTGSAGRQSHDQVAYTRREAKTVRRK